jgi:hypothetical protein
MNQKIGYPDYLNDSKAVDVEYSRYVLFPGDYYRTKFQFYEMYQKGKKVLNVFTSIYRHSRKNSNASR